MGVLCLSLFALLSVLFSFVIILKRKRAGCFAFIVLRMSCYCKCFVALPPDGVGWSAVCDCGISFSYSLTFWLIFSLTKAVIIEKSSNYAAV